MHACIVLHYHHPRTSVIVRHVEDVSELVRSRGSDACNGAPTVLGHSHRANVTAHCIGERNAHSVSSDVDATVKGEGRGGEGRGGEGGEGREGRGGEGM